MKIYTLLTALWLRGNYEPVGSTVFLTKAEAKYIRHAIEPVETVTVPVPDVDEGPLADVVEIVIEDEPATKPKRGRKASADAGQD